MKPESFKVSDEFIKGKNNIGYVDNDFNKEYGNDEFLPGKVLGMHKLTRSMKDSEIISEFKIQECTLGDVLETLKNATEEMKDGYANIFYIKDHPSRVVRVGWDVSDWYVGDWRRGGGAWDAGDRVFSSATVSQNLSPIDSVPLKLDPYSEIVEWLYLNTGNQLSEEMRRKLLNKLKEILK